MLPDCSVLVPSVATIETGESVVTGTTLIGKLAESFPAAGGIDGHLGDARIVVG
jgi:hypothetical protein